MARNAGASNPGAEHPGAQRSGAERSGAPRAGPRNAAAGHEEPALITDAERSFDDEQRARKKVYAILMVIHLTGFALAGVLAHIWWLALGLVALTGPLPWVAVVLANDRRTSKQRRIPRAQRRQLEQ